MQIKLQQIKLIIIYDIGSKNTFIYISTLMNYQNVQLFTNSKLLYKKINNINCLKN